MARLFSIERNNTTLARGSQRPPAPCAPCGTGFSAGPNLIDKHGVTHLPLASTNESTTNINDSSKHRHPTASTPASLIVGVSRRL